MSSQIVRVNHASFTVSDLERSVILYQDVFQFTVTSMGPPPDPTILARITGLKGATGRVAFLQGPGLAVELIEYSVPEDRERIKGRPCDFGFAHLAFDVDNLDAVVAAAQQQGVELVASPTVLGPGSYEGMKAVYLRDWDGCTLELIQAPAPSSQKA